MFIRIIIAFTVLLSSYSVLSQEQLSNSEKLGYFHPVKVKFVQSKIDGMDLEYFSLSFDNAEYDHIVDFGVIHLYKEDVDKFIEVMKKAIDVIGTGVSQRMQIKGDDYIQVYDFSKKIYLYADKDHNKISIKKATLLIELLEAEKHRFTL